MKIRLLLFLLSLSLMACKKEEMNGPVTVTGTLQRQGTTTYQYGTHTLSSSNSFYAVQSSRVSLDTYVGRTVTVTGNKSAGIDGGPELINVETIR